MGYGFKIGGRGIILKEAAISFGNASITVKGADQTGTNSFAYVSDGTPTVTSSNTAVATVAISGSNVVVTYVKAGSVTVTVSIPQTKHYLAVSKSFSVTCSRTATTMTVSKSTLAIAGASGSGTFTYTCNGDGAISVSSSDTNVATASVNTNTKTVTVTYKKAGSTTIKVTMADGTKYATTNKTCTVTCSRSNRTFTLSKTSATLTGPGASTTLTVTFSGDGQLDYASTNTGVAGVSVNKRTTGATATITRTGNGTCAVNFSVAQSDKYNAASGSVSMTCNRATASIVFERPTGSAPYNQSSVGWKHAVGVTIVGNGAISYTYTNTNIMYGAYLGDNNTQMYFYTGKVYKICSASTTMNMAESNDYTAASATHNYAFV